MACKLTLVIAIGLLGCTEPAAEQGEARLGISGGEAVAPGAWPMVVWLDNGCSGVLLQSDLVAYAAHCGDQVENVWLGDSVDLVIDESSQTVTTVGSPNALQLPVAWCRRNPDYRATAGNDVAFCVLDAEAGPDFVGVSPECDHRAITVGTEATLVGFGYGETEDAGVKRSTRAEVAGAGTEILIGDEAHGTCSGDSGGPAFSQVADEWKLLGLLSTGLRGVACGAGYYTPIDTVTRWIETETGRTLNACDQSNASPGTACADRVLDEDGIPQPTSSANPSSDCNAGAPSPPSDQGCALARPSAGGRTSVACFYLLCLFAWTAQRRRHRARALRI